MEHETLLVGFLILISGILAYELGISTAIILIILGVISGNLLGYHSPPLWLNFIASLGLLGIMFFAGTEVNVGIIKRNFVSSLLISICSFFVPFVVIYFLALWLLNLSLISTLIIALSLSTTSISLIYCTVHCERKDTKFYNTIIGSAVLVDIYGTIFLLLLFVGFNIFLISFLAFLLVILLVSPIIWKLIERRYLHKGAEIEVRFVIILLILLAYISSNVGAGDAALAFLTGMIFSRMLGDQELVSEKLRGLIFGFLAPLFFFKAGLLIRFEIVTIEAFVIFLILGTFAYLSKYFGVYLPALKFFNRETARRFGLYFNFRLSFAIIPAFLGLTEGLISEDIYTAIILFVLATTIITAFVLRVSPHEV